MNFSRFSAFSTITGPAERKNSLQMRRFQTISEFSHGLGQQANRTPVQPGMHPIPVEFDFMQPFRPFWRLLDQFRELRSYPIRERHRLGAWPSRGRLRHV
jgi:hypothetical protein